MKSKSLESRMAILTIGAVNLLAILAIGIISGLMFNRHGQSWLGRRAAGATGIGDVTYALVGIAGSFIGFHMTVLLGLLPTPLMLYLGAIAGAVVTIWLWRRS
jgi:hypothetical protein